MPGPQAPGPSHDHGTGNPGPSSARPGPPKMTGPCQIPIPEHPESWTVSAPPKPRYLVTMPAPTHRTPGFRYPASQPNPCIMPPTTRSRTPEPGSLQPPSPGTLSGRPPKYPGPSQPPTEEYSGNQGHCQPPYLGTLSEPQPNSRDPASPRPPELREPGTLPALKLGTLPVPPKP